MKRVPSTLLSLFAQVILPASCQSDLLGPVPSQRKLERTVERVAEEYNLPTVEVSVRAQDKERHVTYHHPDAAPQSRYGVGSTTKFLSAVLVFKLIEEGRLSLEDPIMEYLTGEIPVENLQAITVGQLLNHSSGLTDYSQHPDWIGQVISGAPPISYAEKMALVEASRPNAGVFSYSNTNYLLLEQVVEAIEGQPFAAAFDTFYQGLGLPDILMGAPSPAAQAFFAQTPETTQDASQWDEHHGFAGGASAHAQALNQWLHELFVAKSILGEATLQSMQAWIDIQPSAIPIGEGGIGDYGFGVMRLSYNGKEYLGHYGGTLLYQSFVFHQVEEDISISVVTNCSGRHYNNAFFQALIPQILDEL